MGPVIVWLRRDLRVADNPALHAAAKSGAPVLPVFIHDPAGEWAPGAASRVWLHDSLSHLSRALRALGSPLVLRAGGSERELAALVEHTGARAVYWNRRFDPEGSDEDARVATSLAARCEIRSFNGSLLFEPDRIATGDGMPYRVFTPFSRACLRAGDVGEPLPRPTRLPAPTAAPESTPLDALALEPRVAWHAGIRECWSMGEDAALDAFETFVDEALAEYPQARDFPARAGVSRLSPHLHFGEISPRFAWHALRSVAAGAGAAGLDTAVDAWLRQLLWREFAWHVLHHFPYTPKAPMRPEFAGLQWCDTPAGLAAWQHGVTGFPLVDAGMRELWKTGYMHNRVRMIVASFLCKHLGVHWLEGARWFWDTLVDADLANNTLGWQWSAGCGADAAPYFRIFNPVTQSRRFDARGAYIRRWIPELADVPDRAVHEPGAGGYAEPVLELAPARKAALARYAEIRK